MPSPNVATILRDHVSLSTSCIDRLRVGEVVTDSRAAAGVELRQQAIRYHGLPSGLLGPESRRRTVRIIRNYGLLDRRAAPQYFAAVRVTPAD